MEGRGRGTHHGANDETIISWQTTVCQHLRRSKESIRLRVAGGGGEGGIGRGQSEGKRLSWVAGGEGWQSQVE